MVWMCCQAAFGQPDSDEAFEKANAEVVRLPPSSFPELPTAIRQELDRRKCTVPQTAGSAEPVNVIQGEFFRAGESAWAVLCSVNLETSILVVRTSSPKQAVELARQADLSQLQVLVTGSIGYSRQIQIAKKDFITRYAAQTGDKLPPIDHVGINDAYIGKASEVHYFYRGEWMVVASPD
jgi:hypothetical protein